MKRDLKESLMIISKNDITQYEVMKQLSVEDFLIRYKLFIDEIETKQDVR